MEDKDKEAEKQKLFVYWDGAMPPYIEVMIEIMRKQYRYHALEVVNIENLDRYLDKEKVALYRKIDPYLRRAQMSDIVSCSLLAEHGGIFLDADVLVYQRPYFMEEKLKEYEFVGIGSNYLGYGIRTPVWLMMSHKGAKVMRRWEEKNIQKIKRFFRFLWTDPVLIYLNLISILTRNKNYLQKKCNESNLIWRYSRKKENTVLSLISLFVSSDRIKHFTYTNVNSFYNGMVNPYYYLEWEAYGAPILSSCIKEFLTSKSNAVYVFDEASSKYSFMIVNQFKENPSMDDVLHFFLNEEISVEEVERKVPLTILQFNNGYTGKFFKTASKEEFLTKPWLLSRLAKHTLEKLSKEEK